MVRCAVITSGLLLSTLIGSATADNMRNLNDPTMIATGRQLFQDKQCAYCHGPNGNGAIKLAGRNDLEPNYVFDTISQGRSKGALRMPSWRGVLTEEQIWQATAYVLWLAAQHP